MERISEEDVVAAVPAAKRTRIVRALGDYDGDAVSDVCSVDCSCSKDQTMQQFKNETDINTIVRRFGVTGELPVTARGPAEYGDFSGAVDFHTAMNMVRQAEESFAELPAKIRDRFENDPGKFLEYIHSSDNLEEAVELGILDRSVLPAVEAPVAAPVAVSAPAPTSTPAPPEQQS